MGNSVTLITLFDEKMKNRRWTDDDLAILRLMRQYGLPFSLIAQTLRRSEQAIIVQASKLKIQAPRMSGVDDTDLAENQERFLQLDTKTVGSITEEQVKIRLAIEGFDIFEPYMNNHKTDLLLIHSDRVCRIQVKSAVYDKGNKRFRSILRTKDKSGTFIGYSNSDVDFFIVKCNGLEEYYIVPFEIGDTQHSLNLYPHRLKMRCKGVDFEPYRNAFHLLSEFLGMTEPTSNKAEQATPNGAPVL
jgi:hypothetical protein